MVDRQEKMQTEEEAIELIQQTDQLVQRALLQWDRLKAVLQNRSDDVETGSALLELDVLQQMEEARAQLSSDIGEMEKLQQEFVQREHLLLSDKTGDKIRLLFTGCQQQLKQVLANLNVKMDEMSDLEDEVQESILEMCQNRILTLTDDLLNSRQQKLKDAIRMDLDQESELTDIRDSLEMIRSTRLDSTGDEEDELTLLLESLITSCDSALLIEESSL